MSISNLIQQLKGGANSGNHGHQGRPGKRGGSSVGGIKSYADAQGNEIYIIKSDDLTTITSNLRGTRHAFLYNPSTDELHINSNKNATHDDFIDDVLSNDITNDTVVRGYLRQYDNKMSYYDVASILRQNGGDKQTIKQAEKNLNKFLANDYTNNGVILATELL